MNPDYNRGYYNYPSTNPFLNGNNMMPFGNNSNPYMQGKPFQGQPIQRMNNSPNKVGNGSPYQNKFVTNVNLKSTLTQQDKVIAFGQGRDENFFKQTLRKSYEPSVKPNTYNIITNLPIANNAGHAHKGKEKNKNEYANQNDVYFQQGVQRYNQLKMNNITSNNQHNPKPTNLGSKESTSEKITKHGKDYYEQNCIAMREYAYAEDQNTRYRNYMEDKGFGIDNFNNTKTDALFGIFDGHGGVQVSEYLQCYFPDAFRRILPSKNIQVSISTLFDSIDGQIKKESFCNVGSTACIVFFTNENNKKVIYSANVGDTRSLLISQFGFKRLSYDHRAIDKLEHERITKGGGVIFDGRIYGQLMLSRSIGDWKLKSSGLISTPYITRSEIANDNKYVIIASDGVFDVLEDQDVYQISFEVGNAQDYARRILKSALERGAVDNISCFVIKLI